MPKEFKGIKGVGLSVAGVMFALLLAGAGRTMAATSTFNFTYANRSALLADGWDFMARTSNGATRNTEITTGGNAISYNQASHPGTIRIPLDSGDLWLNLNNSHNSLFRTLPTNWIRVELDITFAPSGPYQQVNLALYQDDDNYVEIARTHYPAFSLVRETNASASVLTTYNAAGANVSMRLERDTTYGAISSYYSLDGTNWTFSGETEQEFVNPRLCIWTGGLSGGSATADLRQVRIVTSDVPFTSTLHLQPLSMVFSSIAGQANTNVQRVNIYRNGPDGFTWSATENASWLSIGSTNGGVPGYCDISVNTAGLTNGVYETVINFTALGAVTNISAMPVTLIINASNRAKIATWKGGKKGAMSVWIDDSDNVMFTELDTAGFDGTYALMGPGSQAPNFTTYHNAGMELGSHTENHPCTPQNGPARRAQLELNISNIVISTPQTQNRLSSFAWPCGANTLREKVWASDYFLISRGYNWNQLEDTTPKDFMDVKSYNSHEHPPFPPADFKTIVDAAIAQGKWANLVFHKFNNDDGAVAYAVGKDVWVGTGGDVTRYIQQRDRTILTNYLQTSSFISFDVRRLPIPASQLRSFETAFNNNDTITFQVSVTNLAPVAGVQVNGYPTSFVVRTSGGETNLFFDTLVTTTNRTILITLSNGPILIATPANKTKVYLQNNPTLTGTLTGVIGGDNITATYSTTANTASSVGTYPITPVFSDPLNRMGNYVVITNLGTLTINKSNAPISLGNLNQTYNGTSHTVTASTIPSGLTVNLTYNGNTISPTNAGSYQVIGTISDSNHQGATTNTLVIAKSNAPVTLNDLSYTYDGTSHSATASTIPNGLTVNLTYNGIAASPTNAGNYQVIGTISDINHQGATTNTFVIAKSNAPVTLNDLSYTYDGTSHTVTASTIPNGLTVNLTYNGIAASPTNAGSYQVIGTISDSNHQGATTNTLVIAKSNAPVTLNDLSYTYDGTSHSATASTIPNGLTVNLTYNGIAASPTNAGNYQVIGTISDINHQGATTNTFVIAKSNAPVTLNDLSYTYDGTSHTVTASTIPNGLTVNLTYNGIAASPTNAGSYQVIGTISDSNHQGATTNTLVIAKSNAPVTLNDLSYTYDGTSHSATASTIPNGLTVNLTYNGIAASPTNAGNYQVIGTISDINHQGATTNTLVIAKSNAPVTLNDLSYTYDGTSHSATASTIPNGLTVNLTYNGIAASPTNAGSYLVIGTISDTNHQGAGTNTLLILTTLLSVEANRTNRMVNRDNPAFTGNLTGVQYGDDITASYSTSATTNSPAGDYAIVPALSDPGNKLPNYTVTTSNGTLTIVGAPQFSNITRSTEGLVQLDCAVFSGRVYDFQYKVALADESWTTFLTNQLATSPTLVITNDAGLTNLQRYYRAVDVSYP